MKKIGLLEVLGRDRRQSAEVEIFGKSKEKWLKKYIKLEDGIPDAYTFRNIVKATPSRCIPCL